eukprot:gene10908-3613_t
MKAPNISIDDTALEEEQQLGKLKDFIFNEDIKSLENSFLNGLSVDQVYERPIGCVLYSKVYSDSDLPSLEETPTSPVPGVHLYEFGSKYDDYYPPVYEIDSKKYGDSIPWTLLQLAAGLGKQKSVDFLISKGADHVPEVGRFSWKIYDSPKYTIKDENELIKPLTKILKFTSNVDEKNITFKIKHLETNNGSFTYSASIGTPNSRFSIEKEDDHLLMEVFLAVMWNDFNAMKSIVNTFQTTNYTMKYFGPKIAGRFKDTDFLAEGYGVPVIIHDAEILEMKKTPFQRMLVLDTKKVGKCLFLDQITQYCERLGNYTNVFFENVEKTKPKDILMIGGGDLVILKKIVQSKLWKDINSFTLVEIDNDVVEMSKKYFHPNAESWINDPKIKIKIQDANRYVLDLPNEVKYDAILMDTTDPEIMISLKLFQKDFFLKLKNHHMHPHTFILMQYGLIEEKTPNIYVKNVFSKINHPKSASFFKTKIYIKYTPEYIGHTVFYKMMINSNHTHFIPITESQVDFTKIKNQFNVTYGNHITLIKEDKFPSSNLFNVTMYGVSFDKISNEKSFCRKMKDIIEFSNGVVEKLSYKLRNGQIKAVFNIELEAKLEFLSLNETTISFLLYVVKSELIFYNTIEMIVHYFKPKNYSSVYEYPNMKNDFHLFTNYTKGDLVAYESGEYTFIHGAKILDWIHTDFQKALYFESKELGRGLMVDSSIQMFQNTKNYVDFYYSKIKEFKSKKILIIGGSDIRVLERISTSDLMNSIEEITMVDADEEVYNLSKKYFHPKFDEWFNSNKTHILFDDPNKYVLDLPKEREKFDLIIMDTTSPESFQEYDMFQMDFFNKLNQFHMNENARILLHSGFVTDDGYLRIHNQKKPNFLKLFNYKTEAVFTPEYTGSMIFYLLSKKN